MDNKVKLTRSKRLIGIFLKTLRSIPFLLGFIVLAFLIFYFFFVKGETWPHDPDRERVVDIQVIRREMEVYYGQNDSRYPQSNSIPSSIGNFSVPLDPKGALYSWIDNTSDPQTFCVWAKLEKKVAYYIASHCGVKETNRQPTSLDECCELTKP